MAARAARALVNREVRARFRRGECGPLKVTAGDMDKITTTEISTVRGEPRCPAEVYFFGSVQLV
jgi:hypothetical protein